MILQEFDLEFSIAKSKKLLVFVELIRDLPSVTTYTNFDELIPDETVFLINTLDPWYVDIIVYHQTQIFLSELSNFEPCRFRHQSQPYRIIGDTLYHVGFDYILHRCLTLQEYERVLNDYHSRAYGGHM